MGLIRISVEGSFRHRGTAEFSAYNHGHTNAVEAAIRHLEKLRTKAIKQDLDQAHHGDKPANGFGTTVATLMEEDR